MSFYSDRQSRLSHSFVHSATSCTVECGHCKRVHFTSARGHGDYNEGELEDLQNRAKVDQDKYIEWTEFDSIDTADFAGVHFVLGCPCEFDERLAAAIEDSADDLVTYLSLFAADRKQKREWEADSDGRILALASGTLLPTPPRKHGIEQTKRRRVKAE